MSFRQSSSRWASLSVWVFAAGLLLKTSMPWLASASAQLQGKTLVEVCTVYGVSTVSAGGAATTSAPDHSSDHGREHCALTALTALAQVDAAVFASAPVSRREASSPRWHRSSQAPDACATWVARLKHGPPAFT